jgi:dihydropteroate synthase
MTHLVGILNVTPDSFSDGGLFLDKVKALKQAKQLLQDGASLVDVGAESTRPKATPLTSDQEWSRLEPILKVMIPAYPGKISLDSYHPETIKRAFVIGPVIVNDVTGMNNPRMIDTIIKLNATCIISHLPQLDIQSSHQQKPINNLEQVKSDLLEKAELLIKKGLSKDKIILDPGIGFGKTMKLNQELLKFAEHVRDYKVMIGYSRKRFLGEHRMKLKTNLLAGQIAIDSGAAYIRVHDVAGHRILLK